MPDNDIIRQIKRSQPPLPAGFEQRRDALLTRLTQEDIPMTKKKLTLSLVLAMVLALAAIAVAIAAGLGVFGKLADSSHDKSKMEKLETLSGTYQNSVTLPAQDGFAETTFTLDQGYYDGESLYVSYAVAGDANTGELLEGKPNDSQLTAYEDHGRTEDIALSFRPLLGDTFWDQVEERIRRDGYAWFQLYSQYLSDGAYYDEDTYINPSASDYQLQEGGGSIGFTEFERPLPDVLRNKQSADVYMLIYRGTTRYYLTQDKALATGDRTYIKLPMHIEKATEEPQILTGAGDFPGYSAEARVKISPVEIKADIFLTSKDPLNPVWEKEAGKEDETEDYLSSYNLYANGQLCEHTEYTGSITDARLQITMGFERPATYEKLQLIPVYRLSREHKDEAIDLK